MKLTNIHKTNIESKPIIVGKCPKCGNDLVRRRGRFGEFTSCSNYPNCKYIEKENDNSNIVFGKCPECGNDLLVKKTKTNEYFYGCSTFPNCSYSKWPEDNDEFINNLVKKDKETVNDKNLDNALTNHEENNYSQQFKNEFRDDLQMEVRSSWEANVARTLKHLNIEFEYETDGFQLDSKNSSYLYASQLYVPDFILKNKTLIEVKGHIDYRSLQNTKLFLEKFPNEKLIIIDSDIYYLLNKKYSSIIPNWENEKINIMSNIITVVGITFKERAQHVSKLLIDDELYLERDNNNQYDKNAIKVLDKDNNHLGFMSGDFACFYAPKLDNGITYNIILKEVEDKALKVFIKANNLDTINISSIIDFF
ncbi:MAG: topoisomerase DNA-binding C4 zinc finger domain-containing protein [Bacilli bacterium]